MKSSFFYISLLLNLLFIGAFLFALNRYGGWKQLWSKINNKGVSQAYFDRKQLFELMPTQDSTIVFLGNSITAGGEWSEFYLEKKIVNRGIPGDHCDGVRDRIDAIKKLNPVKLFLLIGINDLCYHPPEIVLVKYENLLAALISKLPQTTIYVQSIFPVNNEVSPTPVNNAEIIKMNIGIKSLAEQFDLPFIDLFPLLLDENGNLAAEYTTDGLHLSGKAYLKWAQFLSNKVNNNN